MVGMRRRPIDRTRSSCLLCVIRFGYTDQCRELSMLPCGLFSSKNKWILGVWRNVALVRNGANGRDTEDGKTGT